MVEMAAMSARLAPIDVAHVLNREPAEPICI
jgi:hypothetical protein